MRAIEGPRSRFLAAALRAPLNQRVLDELRTADRHGLALSVIRDGRKPGARWLPTDRALAVALTRLDATTCTGCGQPIGEAWSGEHEHTVHTQTCTACAALDSWRDKHKDPAPGVKTYVERTESLYGATKFGPTFG